MISPSALMEKQKEKFCSRTSGKVLEIYVSWCWFHYHDLRQALPPGSIVDHVRDCFMGEIWSDHILSRGTFYPDLGLREAEL